MLFLIENTRAFILTQHLTVLPSLISNWNDLQNLDSTFGTKAQYNPASPSFYTGPFMSVVTVAQFHVLVHFQF